MQQASADVARKREQARWMGKMEVCLELREQGQRQAEKLRRGWEWVDKADGEERERREQKWIDGLREYERVMRRLQEAERDLRELQATG